MRIHRVLAAVVVACCAALAPAVAGEGPPEKPVPRVPMRPEGTAIEASLAMPGFVMNEKALAKLRQDLGPGAIVAGSGEFGVMVQVVVIREEGPHRTSAEWCKEVMKSDDPMETFDAEGIACYDKGEERGGMKQASLHAFPVAAGWCFHIEMTQLGDPEDREFLNRRKFRGMVETFRVASFRRGGAADYSPDVVDQLHAVALKYPDWKAAADAAVAAKPGEWVPAFVAWQSALAFAAPPADAAAANETVAQLLAKANPTDAPSCFAWASVEEAAGISLHGAGKYKLAAVRLKKALDVAPASAVAFRGDIAYGLARANAKAMQPKEALAALKTAIDADPAHRGLAAKEPDFTVLRTRPEFKALVAVPAPGK